LISTNDVRPGMALALPDGLFSVLEYQHVKPGKGRAFVRMRLKKVGTGQVLDRTFRADEDLPRAIIERKDHQYLFRDDLGFNFMDLEEFSQFATAAEDVGDAANYLVEGDTVTLALYNGTPIGVELPASAMQLVGFPVHEEHLSDVIQAVNYIFNKPNGPWNPVPVGVCCL